MRVYYNEFDKFNAAWLRRLIEAGHLPKGDVDDRDIREVKGRDLKGYDQVHLFCGIGGWPYAAMLAGWPTDLPLWTGSAPCQPFSNAVRVEKKGFEDERHLWPEFYRLIQECRPPVVAGEQVASTDGLAWLDAVFADLEDAGYACGAANLAAAGVGAPHIRQRTYWLGDAEFSGLERHSGDGDGDDGSEAPGPDAETSGRGAIAPGVDALPLLRGLDLHDSRAPRSGLRLPANRGLGPRPLWAEFEALACSDGWRPVRPGSFPMANGLSSRVGRLHAYGNAIVPQVGAAFLKAYLSTRPGHRGLDLVEDPMDLI